MTVKESVGDALALPGQAPGLRTVDGESHRPLFGLLRPLLHAMPRREPVLAWAVGGRWGPSGAVDPRGLKTVR